MKTTYLRSDGIVRNSRTTARASCLCLAICFLVGSSFLLTAALADRVVIWGQSYAGQAASPSNVAGIVQIQGGWTSSSALLSDGTVRLWGQFIGGVTNPLPGINDAMAISTMCSGFFGLAVRSNGTVMGWADASGSPTNIPPGLAGVTAVAAGGQHALALKSDHTVVAWGNNNYGQTNVPAALSDVVAIAAGSTHSLALKADGTVVTWGSLSNVPPDLNSVAAIACGDNHNLALRTHGTVVGWGWNSGGQTNVPSDLRSVIAVAGGRFHSAALRADGTVVTWGQNDYGQTNVPAGLSGVASIACGSSHTLARYPGFPLISQQPWNRIVPESINGAPLFTVAAAPYGPFAYQWRRNGNDIPDATNATFAATNIQITDAGNYSVVLSNFLGLTVSSNVSLVVTPPLCQALKCSGLDWKATGQASWFSQTNVTFDGVDAAESGLPPETSFSSTMETTVPGPATVTFLWKTATVPGRSFLEFNGTERRLLGGNTDWVLEKVYIPASGLTLSWTLHRSCCTPDGFDKGWVDRLTIVPGGTAPSITNAPVSGVAAIGGSYIFTAGAAGTPPFRYQWLFNGAKLQNATNQSLLLSNLLASSAGNYTIIVSNDFGSASATARLGFEVKPPVLWAVAPGNPQANSSTGNGIAVDSDGACYIVGTGYVAIAQTAAPGGPGFLARFNSDSNLQWVQPCGAQANGVSIGPDGFIYASGQTSGSDWFAGTHSATTNSYYLAKFEPHTGTNVWVRFFGNAGYFPEGPVVAASAHNQIYVAGNTFRTSVFGATTFYARADNPFVALYTVDGDFAWVRSGGATNYPGSVSGIATDPAGNVIVTGYTGAPATIESNTIYGYSCCGYNAMFALKYSPEASPTFIAYQVNYYENRNADFAGAAIGMDSLGNTYVALNVFDSISVGLYNQVVWSKYSSNCCVSCFSCSHRDNVAKPLKSSDHSRALAVDASGNNFLAGDFQGAIDFGGNTNLRLETANTNTFFTDAFLTRLDPAGAWMWAERLSGPGNDSARGVALGKDGSVYFTGYFQTNATIQNKTLTSSAPTSLFVVRLDSTRPFIQSVTRSTTNLTLAFQTQTGVSYLTEYKAGLGETNWLPLTNTFGDGTLQFINDLAPVTGQRFYRLRVP